VVIEVFKKGSLGETGPVLTLENWGDVVRKPKL
jgi:hypothetical protein